MASATHPVLQPVTRPVASDFRAAARAQGGASPLPIGSRMASFGDSIIANGGPFHPSSLEWNEDIAGPQVWANALAGGKLFVPQSSNFGVVGNTTTQMLARVNDVLSVSPDIVIMDGGTNDVTAFNGSGGSDYSTALATTVNNLKAIYAALFAGGVRYIIDSSILPRNGGYALNANGEAFRQALSAAKLALASSRVKVINGEAFNPSTMTNDGIHPNGLGGAFLGQLYAEQIDAVTPAGDGFEAFANTGSNNPTMVGSGGTVDSGTTGVAPNGFALRRAAFGGGLAGAIVELDGRRWAQMQLSGTFTAANQVVADLAAIFFNDPPAAGEHFQAMVEMEYEGLQNVAGVFLRISALNSSFTNLGFARVFYPFSTADFPAGYGRMVLRTPVATAQPGTPDRWQIQMGAVMKNAGGTLPAAGTIRFGRNGIRKIAA